MSYANEIALCKALAHGHNEAGESVSQYGDKCRLEGRDNAADAAFQNSALLISIAAAHGIAAERLERLQSEIDEKLR